MDWWSELVGWKEMIYFQLVRNEGTVPERREGLVLAVTSVSWPGHNSPFPFPFPVVSLHLAFLFYLDCLRD